MQSCNNKTSQDTATVAYTLNNIKIYKMQNTLPLYQKGINNLRSNLQAPLSHPDYNVKM